MSRDQLTTQLVEAGRERAQAMAARQAATKRIGELIPRAYRAGIGVTEIGRLTGMTNRAIYDVLHANGEALSR